MVPEDTLQLLADQPALAYREYLYRPRGRLRRRVSDWFEPLAVPGQFLGQPPRAGDVLLEVILGRHGPGRCAVLAPGDVEPLAAQRRLAPGQLLLRPRPRTEISAPLPAEPPADGELGWFTAGPAVEAEDGPEAEYDPGEVGDQAGAPVPIDTAAAVPPVTAAERATVTQPLLSAQASARAVAWTPACTQAPPASRWTRSAPRLTAMSTRPRYGPRSTGTARRAASRTPCWPSACTSFSASATASSASTTGGRASPRSTASGSSSAARRHFTAACATMPGPSTA